jgi:L-lactate dehydrogenase complex protein LldG
MMSRENVLHRVRTALGRNAGQLPPEAPVVRLRIPEVGLEARVASMTARLEALAGRVERVARPSEARAVTERLVSGKTVVASDAPYLAECAIPTLPGVRSGIHNREELRDLCAAADIGITSADYALADTGTLVLLSRPGEARLISLLPPTHIAVLPCSRILTGLDELFSVLPDPAGVASSMVLITGPSRTADIEQILVRGVHGPGQLMVVLVG